jgi:hypothetical protein
LEQRWEHILAGSISDVVLLGERVFVALGDGLVVLEHGEVAQSFDGSVRRLVTSDDEQTLLAVSAPVDAPPHYPRRRFIPAEEKRCTRRIYRISHPWTALEELGVVPVDGWSTTFDGRYWPTFSNDDVHLFECTATGIALRTRLETFWPYHIERIPQGIWVELPNPLDPGPPGDRGRRYPALRDRFPARDIHSHAGRSVSRTAAHGGERRGGALVEDLR